jgi:hypothetical protein
LLIFFDPSPQDGFLVSKDREQRTFERHQMLASSKTLKAFQMPAGDYEFPFMIALPSGILDTVTGPNHEYHTYHVEAVIERRFWKDFTVSRPIRIYHPPDQDTVSIMQRFPLV